METKHQPLSHPKVFRQRVLTELVKAGMILTGSLIMGILGYHYFANLDWIDSVYNARMILGCLLYTSSKWKRWKLGLYR